MKNSISLLQKLTSSNTAQIIFRTYVTPFLFAIITLTSCSNDDEIENPDIVKLVGTYAVADTDEGGDVENYSIKITKGKDGGVEISNFGDFMYVPVKATITGNKFTVPPQTFKAKSTIVVSGNGTLNGNNLNFDYVIETDDDYVLEHSCVANKSN